MNIFYDNYKRLSDLICFENNDIRLFRNQQHCRTRVKTMSGYQSLRGVLQQVSVVK